MSLSSRLRDHKPDDSRRNLGALWVTREMYSYLTKIKKTYNLTYAEALRCIIEWAMEEEGEP